MCKAFVKGLKNCGNPNGSRYHQKMALYTELYKNKDNEKLGAFANGQSQDGGDSASIMSSKSQPGKLFRFLCSKWRKIWSGRAISVISKFDFFPKLISFFYFSERRDQRSI